MPTNAGLDSLLGKIVNVATNRDTFVGKIVDVNLYCIKLKDVTIRPINSDASVKLSFWFIPVAAIQDFGAQEWVV